MAAVARITVIGAHLNKDEDWIGKMDPYVVLESNGQKFETQVAQGQGANPSWNQQFSFNVGQNDQLKISVYDSDVGPDEFLGAATINLRAYLQHGVFENAIPLANKKGPAAGQLQLRIQAN